MEFNSSNYEAIKSACNKKEEIAFNIKKSATAFSSSEAPSDWMEYPPTVISPQEYAQAIALAGPDLQGAFSRLEVVVHLSGGNIYYKKLGQDSVDVKIVWPDA